MRKKILVLVLIEGAMLWLTVVLRAALDQGLEPSGAALTALPFARAFVFAAAIVISLYVADLYDIARLRQAAALPQRFLRALGVSACLLALIYVLFPSARLTGAILMPAGIAALILLLAVRVALSRIVRRGQPERVLVLGNGPFAATIVSAVRADLRAEHVIVGMLDLVDDGLVLQRKLDEILRRARPDRIVVAAIDRTVPLPFKQLIEGRLHGIAVEDGLRFYERFARRIVLDRLTADSVAFGDGFSEARLHAVFARTAGVLSALIALIALAPILLLAASIIRIKSSGPILVVNQRVGRYGRPYGLIRLRTTYATKPVASGLAHESEGRITPFGRWLCRFGIDGLPQLINVLKGDMNLVGPRPHPVSEYLSFMKRIPHYAQRSQLRPGLTGWAQVRCVDADKPGQEVAMMGFDLFYIRNVSIGLDLQVMLGALRRLVDIGETSGVEAQRTVTLLSRTTTVH